MFSVRYKIGKKIIHGLMTLNCFNKHFVVLLWDKTYIIRRNKSIDELTKIKITPNNILTLKFKFHSSQSILKEYIAEIDKLDCESHVLYLKIWRTEQKSNLIMQASLNVTEQTNETLKQLLDQKVFNEKYGENYSYFISLHLDREIVSAKGENRQFSEVTLKYSLKTELKETEMRLKSKFRISKNEAKNLCSMVSFWDINNTNP